MASVADPQLTLLRPYFKPSPPLVSIAGSSNNNNNNNNNTSPSSSSESPSVQATIAALNLSPHPEGGYFAVTDIDQTSIPCPYSSSSSSSSSSPSSSPSPSTASASTRTLTRTRTRNLSSTIFYLLTPGQPAGHFHKCRTRIIHSLHRGRARYVLIHPPTGRVESFVVGADILAGERLQWVVAGDVWKATILLPDDAAGPEPASDGMLITETVAPGFDYSDHAFLTVEHLNELVPRETAEQLEWLIKK